MDSLPDPVALVAIDTVRGIRRRWSASLAHDLFGAVVVTTAWGRIGTAGQQARRSFADAAAARRHLRALLARRASAERRIGVAYVPER